VTQLSSKYSPVPSLVLVEAHPPEIAIAIARMTLVNKGNMRICLLRVWVGLKVEKIGQIMRLGTSEVAVADPSIVSPQTRRHLGVSHPHGSSGSSN
jgi:hypothetical protein